MSLLAAQAGMMVGSGGGGGGAGLPPSAYAGLTFWYDGDNSAHYNGSADSSGTPSDGQTVGRFDSVASISRVFVGGAGLDRKTPVYGSSGGVVSDGGILVQGMVKPSAGASPSTAIALSNLISAGDAAFVAAVRVDSAATEAYYPYNNAVIFADAHVHFGVHVYRSGSNAVFMGLNYDGSYDKVTAAGPALGSWAIVTVKHTGGQLRVRVNGGSWSSISSGNTSLLTNNVFLFENTNSDGFVGACAQLCTYNANRSDAELLEVERYFGAKVGVTVP